MSHAWSPVAAAVGLLLLAGTMAAQTLPVPALPPEQPPNVVPGAPGQGVPTADVGVAPGVQPRRPWEYGLGVGIGYDSNIDFIVPDGPSSWAISPRGNLSRTFWSPQGELRLGGTGSWVGYREQQDLNRYTGSVSLDGTHRSSLTTWRGGASYELGYSDSSEILGEQGVLLPLVETNTIRGSLGVSRMLGLRTSFRLDGRFYRTEFDEEDSDDLGLVEGQSLRGTVGLERRLSSRDTLALEYSLEDALAREPPEPLEEDGSRHYLTHFGSLQWSHLLSPRSGFLLEAGASYTPDAERVGLERRESFYGGVSYSRQVRRSAFTLFARREVAPAFGLGVSRVENRFGLTATIPMGRAWTLQLMGRHVRPETPEGAEYTYGTPDEAFVTLSCRLGRHFEVSGEGRYRRRGATGEFLTIEAYQAGLFVSLVSPLAGSASPSRR